MQYTIKELIEELSKFPEDTPIGNEVGIMWETDRNNKSDEESKEDADVVYIFESSKILELAMKSKEDLLEKYKEQLQLEENRSKFTGGYRL